MNKFLRNPCNLYFLLWCLNNLNGFLYPEGTILNKLFLLLILLISLKEFIHYFQYERVSECRFFRGLNLLLLMYTVYGLLVFVTDGMTVYSKLRDPYSSISFIQGAWIIILPIYVCYLYTKRGYLTLELLQRWMVVFLLVGVSQYYTIQRQMLQSLIAQGINKSDINNGAGYILLSLIPGMLVFKKKLISYLGIGICVVFIIMSMKRGAIIIASLSLLLIIGRDLKKSKGKNKLIVFFLVILGLTCLLQFVNHMLETSDYFNARIEATLEGDSSNRDIIYKEIWNDFLYDSDPLQWLFGRGAMSTLKYFNIYAHNDWLEIIFCHGIIGIVIFINYWKRLFDTFKSRTLCEPSRFCLLLIFCIYLTKSFFSMSIIGMPIYSTAMLGFALADGFEQCAAHNYFKL